MNPSLDCNHNGVIDSCGEADCNNNNIPDGCEYPACTGILQGRLRLQRNGEPERHRSCFLNEILHRAQPRA